MSEKRFFIKKIDDDFCILDSFDDKNVVIYCDSERAIQECCDLLNEQDRRINVLKNNCSVMNQRLLEKECNYKKAIIEFCKFMNINTPLFLLDVMVDEFLQEVF